MENEEAAEKKLKAAVPQRSSIKYFLDFLFVCVVAILVFGVFIIGFGTVALWFVRR